ncbi:MAG: TlyA family RNA methyltransferase [Oscillospiraceae bacterium]|jgi:23S rRNA (cytidine1920-2'-O)/16S rRNA (cytidine1409-2'-O)-methyltransferase|nr:TlyA family RNA methyltransferase [Oscillospiraceae bacterium]
MPEERVRLDAYLISEGFTTGRDKAKALIMTGDVYVNNQRELKAGRVIKTGDTVEVRRNNILPFVSRGGNKLSKAIEVFGIGILGKVCMDVGSSTGGFTDCMLQNGAEKVYAVDVGYGQLAYKLRIDSRVTVLERTNFRYVTQKEISESIDFASVDVSFISLKLLLPVLYGLLAPEGEAVLLIKPQFEAGRERVGKKGVVRDAAVQEDVIRSIMTAAIGEGFFPVGLDYSPIKGPEGNIEFLLYICKQAREAVDLKPSSVVAAAWEQLV